MNKQKIIISGVIGILVLFLFCSVSSAFDSDKTIISPVNPTAEKGKTFKITVSNVDGGYTKGKVDVIIKYISSEAYKLIYWVYTVNVSTDTKTITLRFTVPVDADSGTYTIEIITGLDQTSLDATVYLPEDAQFNWTVFMFLIVLGVVCLIVTVALWKKVRQSKGLTDDAILVLVLIGGVCLIVTALCQVLGLLSTWGLVGLV